MQANWLAVCSHCYKERQIIGLILTWELNNFQQFLSVSYTDYKSMIKVCMLKTALGYWTIIDTYRNAFLKGEFVKVYIYVLLYWMHESGNKTVYQTGNWPAKSWLFLLNRKPRVALIMINRLIIWPVTNMSTSMDCGLWFEIACVLQLWREISPVDVSP